MKNIRTKISIRLLSALIIFSTSSQKVYAASFAISQHTQYTLSEEYVTIRKSTEITNNTSNRYISGSETQTLNIDFFSDSTPEIRAQMLDSLKVSSPNYTIDETETVAKVNISFGSDLHSGDTQIFWIEYKDYQLVNKVGNLINFYVPKQQVAEESALYDYYRTFTVYIPKEFDADIFTQVEPTQRFENDDYQILDFSIEQLYEGAIHIQIGDSQKYRFEIQTVVPQSHVKKVFSSLAKNEVTLVLPMDFTETNQMVFIESISPEPTAITTDSLGNVFATFLLNADSAHEIKIVGYIEIQYEAPDLPQTVTLSDLPNEYLSYTIEEEYWEVSSGNVKTAVSGLPSSETVSEIIENTYAFVVDALEYDHEKYLNNIRLGATATLSGSPAVCMEYADTMITLLRAQGVPAIAAYGRGFNPDVPASEQENHQWLLAYVPDYGWLTVDPTWGENGRNFIGPDLERVLWYVSGEGPESVAPLSHRTVDDLNVPNPVISFTPVETIDKANSVPLSTLVTTKEESRILEWVTNFELSIIPRLLDDYFVVFVLVGTLFAASVIISVIKLGLRIYENISRKVLVQPSEGKDSIPSKV